MRPYVLLIATLMLLGSSGMLFAQCAPGIPGGGNPSCVPPDVFYNSLPPGSPPPDLGPQWSTRWGAVAAGGNTLGVSANSTSKRKAVKAALSDCKKNGGGRCTVLISYYDQCVAAAWGDGAASSIARGPVFDEAIATALDSCSKRGPNCKIYYSGCSYPVRIR
jgi:Domain of unknown function (DUF4189)